jgi:hypothetical protein
MTSLAREAENVQNAALGAALIWRFCCSFVDAHPTRDHPRIQHVLLVLPIVLHQATAEFLRGTLPRSGLRAFATKFGESRTAKQDLLLQLHDRVVRWRSLSLDSLQLAAAGSLVSVTPEGEVVPMSHTSARGVPDEVKRLMRDAEKLGQWCGLLTIHEIANTLKVRL